MEHHLETLHVSLKGGCTGSTESELVKIPHCWKSHVVADSSRYLLEGHLISILIHTNLFTLQFKEEDF